jgi:hypothetical protein
MDPRSPKGDSLRPTLKRAAALPWKVAASLGELSAGKAEPRTAETVRVAIAPPFPAEQTGGRPANLTTPSPERTRIGDQSWSAPDVFLSADKHGAEVGAQRFRLLPIRGHYTEVERTETNTGRRSAWQSLLARVPMIVNRLALDGLLANECVQQRLACSVGDSPTGVRVRAP